MCDDMIPWKDSIIITVKSYGEDSGERQGMMITLRGIRLFSNSLPLVAFGRFVRGCALDDLY